MRKYVEIKKSDSGKYILVNEVGTCHYHIKVGKNIVYRKIAIGDEQHALNRFEAFCLEKGDWAVPASLARRSLIHGLPPMKNIAKR